MMGRFEVLSPQGEITKFRSRTALCVLAYLLLHPDKEIPHQQLHELFWPESDGDKQAQNLRRAISDLRSVLEEDLAPGCIVTTRKGFVGIESVRIVTDAQLFLEVSDSALAGDQVDNLAEAASLYGGPLLAQMSDGWVLPLRMEMEEVFCQVVGRLVTHLILLGRTREAIRIGRSALVVAPAREDVHVALIRAYSAAGMESEALRQFEALEQALDETWGEPPSQQALDALRRVPADTQPSGLEAEPSGGALPPTSHFYVRRAADKTAGASIEQKEGVILLQGPRQVGKSSLLARLLRDARQLESEIVLIDFQTLGEAQLKEEQRIYKTLCHSVVDQLKLDLDIETLWRPWLGSNMNLDSIVGKCLAKSRRHVYWAMDEADMLFDRPYTNDLFGLLRSWHNRRALDPGGPWSHLSLILSYATEASLFVSDLNQSPFNVGIRIPLRDFSPEEVRELQQRHPKVDDPEASKCVHAITGGHPYLCQCAFGFLASGGDFAELNRRSSDLEGPFGDHLRRVLVSVVQSESIHGQVLSLLGKEEIEDPSTRLRLESAGITRYTGTGGTSFRVPIYETFLRKHLIS
jgi:DNA-binding SARP family transcriptional activator